MGRGGVVIDVRLRKTARLFIGGFKPGAAPAKAGLPGLLYAGPSALKKHRFEEPMGGRIGNRGKLSLTNRQGSVNSGA